MLVGPQMSPAPLVELGTVNLDPSPNAAGADGQPSLLGYFRHLRDRNWIPQIPPHAPHDDVARIVSPFEWIRAGDGHVSPLPDRPHRFSQRNPPAPWDCNRSSGWGATRPPGLGSTSCVERWSGLAATVCWVGSRWTKRIWVAWRRESEVDRRSASPWL